MNGGMNNFIFKVYDIRSADNDSLWRGKRYSGTVKHGDKIRFVGRNGSFDNINENVGETLVGSFTPSILLDCLIIDSSYIEEVYDARDKHIWIIDAGNNPCMEVVDTFDITNKGIVVTGVVAAGCIRVNDEMSILTPNGKVKSVTVMAIERCQNTLQIASEGDTVGIILNGIQNKSDIPTGSLLCKKLCIS